MWLIILYGKVIVVDDNTITAFNTRGNDLLAAYESERAPKELNMSRISFVSKPAGCHTQHPVKNTNFFQVFRPFTEASSNYGMGSLDEGMVVLLDAADCAQRSKVVAVDH